MFAAILTHSYGKVSRVPSFANFGRLHSGAPPATQTVSELDFERGMSGAALSGDDVKLQKLLASGRHPDGDRTGGAGLTPLHFAARNTHTRAAELLLRAGAAVNAVSHGGATALHRAAIGGRLEMVELLLRHGADPLAQDSDGETPLFKAASAGNEPAAKLLARWAPAALELRTNKEQLPTNAMPALLSASRPGS